MIRKKGRNLSEKQAKICGSGGGQGKIRGDWCLAVERKRKAFLGERRSGDAGFEKEKTLRRGRMGNQKSIATGSRCRGQNGEEKGLKKKKEVRRNRGGGEGGG